MPSGSARHRDPAQIAGRHLAGRGFRSRLSPRTIAHAPSNSSRNRCPVPVIHGVAGDPHWHRRRLELFQEGDARQVMALDCRAPGCPPYYLHEGAADEIRGDVDGRFRCPLMACPYPQFSHVRSGSRRDHFVHRHAPGLNHTATPADACQIGTDVLMHWLRSRGCTVTAISRRATDARAELLAERRVAPRVPRTRVLLIFGDLSEREVLQTTEDTWDEGFEPWWFIGVPSTIVSQPSGITSDLVRVRRGAHILRELAAPTWLFNPMVRWGLGSLTGEGGLAGDLARIQVMPLFACEVTASGPAAAADVADARS